MEPVPSGVLLSREEDAIGHGYVFYGLVKPCKDGGVQSAAGMANVIPRKRIYRMEHSDELECFREELLKRPLVLQPCVQVGSGIQKINCFFNVKKENWVMMINQTHPKIVGRIMMGIDAAKKAMRRGEPFILEFTFSDILKRFYFDLVGRPSTRFEKLVYMDCEHADLTVRFAGDYFHQGMSLRTKGGHIKFSFEDLSLSEVKLRTLNEAAAQRPSPIIQIVPEYELKFILPGWKFVEADIADEEEEEEEEGAVGYENYEKTGNSYVQYDSPAENCESVPDKPGRIRGRANRNKPSSKYEVPIELHVPNKNVDKGDNSHSRYENQDSGGFSQISSDPKTQRNMVSSHSDNRYEQFDNSLQNKSPSRNMSLSQPDNRYEQLNYKHQNNYQEQSNYYPQDEHHYEGYRSPRSHSNYKNDNHNEKIYSPGNRSYHHHHGSGRSGSSSAADSGYGGDNLDNGGFENGKYGQYNRHPEKIHRDLEVHQEGSHRPYDNPAYNYEFDHSPKDANKTMAAQILQHNNYNAQIRSPRQNYNYDGREMESKYSDRRLDQNSSQELQWSGLQSEAVSESFI